jgi:hypothetical protein
MIAEGERVVDPSKTTQQKKEGFLTTKCTIVLFKFIKKRKFSLRFDAMGKISGQKTVRQP